MLLASRRIVLDPVPNESATEELDVLFLGHAPGRVRPGRLAESARSELTALGFDRIMNRLPKGDEDPQIDARDDALTVSRLRKLQQLPLPIRSIAEFTQLFPEARLTSCHYVSHLAGDRAWLQPSLEDFFHAGGRKAWAVVLPEDEEPVRSFAKFLPTRRRSVLENPWELLGVELVALLPYVGLVCCPDLERLAIPTATRSVESLPLAQSPPIARFVPLRGEPELTIASPEPTFTSTQLPGWTECFASITGLLLAVRPDVQLLLAAPFAPNSVDGIPVVDRDALVAAEKVPDPQRARLQPIFPYLSSPGYRLGSPVGVVAGSIASSTRTRGAWRSVAGLSLRSESVPTPQVHPAAAAAMRDDLHLSVLLHQGGHLVLDDERCRSAEWKDSAEVVRFVGWLRRQLTRLGESLVFRVDPGDPRPELALLGFGHELFRLGALNAAQAEDGFSVERLDLPGDDGLVGFAIRLAPAYPIDQIVLTFMHTRDRWQVEVA